MTGKQKICVLAALALTACARTASLDGLYDAPWRHLRVGALAYIGNDNTDSQERYETLCPSVDFVIQWWENNNASKRCFRVKHGTPVRVEAIVLQRSGTTPEGDPLEWLGSFAKVRGIDRHFEGYTPVGFLQPKIHVGTVIPMVRDWSDGLTLTHHQQGDDVIDLPHDVSVKVLAYRPDLRGRTLFVKVLEGPYKNRRGWMGIEDAAPPPGLDAGLYGVIDPAHAAPIGNR